MTTGGNETDAGLVERVAEAIHAVEYGRFNPDADEDYNRWTWRGINEPQKVTWRLYAAAAIAAMEEKR